MRFGLKIGLLTASALLLGHLVAYAARAHRDR